MSDGDTSEQPPATEPSEAKEENGDQNKEDLDEEEEEPEIVTMLDVLKEETELEENVDAGMCPLPLSHSPLTLFVPCHLLQCWVTVTTRSARSHRGH